MFELLKYAYNHGGINQEIGIAGILIYLKNTLLGLVLLMP